MAREGETTAKPGEPKHSADDFVTPAGGEGRIKCPSCGWTPAGQHVWMCSCQHLWHTFDTGGVCPNCIKQWLETQCLKCRKWSPHSLWYPAV